MNHWTIRTECMSQQPCHERTDGKMLRTGDCKGKLSGKMFENAFYGTLDCTKFSLDCTELNMYDQVKKPQHIRQFSGLKLILLSKGNRIIVGKRCLNFSMKTKNYFWWRQQKNEWKRHNFNVSNTKRMPTLLSLTLPTVAIFLAVNPTKNPIYFSVTLSQSWK